MRRVTRSNQGFTLIEVLIGMSLLSIMMLLLLASLRICIQNWDAGERKIAEVNQLAVLQSFFSRYLQSIRPLSDNFSYDEPEFSFQGDQTNMQFVASMPASAGRMGLQVFRIGLIPSKENNSKNIMVSISPFFPLTEGEEWKLEEVVVLENVKKMEFSYFGVSDFDTGEAGTWSEDWIGMDHLPLLIQVGIEMENGDIWPSFIVAPRNEVNIDVNVGSENFGGDREDNQRGNIEDRLEDNV